MSEENFECICGFKPIAIGISKTPEDPEAKREWAVQMGNIQINMWIVDEAICLHCNHFYTSVGDFKRRSPVRGHTKDMSFVCKECYPSYKMTLKEKSHS